MLKGCQRLSVGVTVLIPSDVMLRHHPTPPHGPGFVHCPHRWWQPLEVDPRNYCSCPSYTIGSRSRFELRYCKRRRVCHATKYPNKFQINLAVGQQLMIWFPKLFTPTTRAERLKGGLGVDPQQGF